MATTTMTTRTATTVINDDKDDDGGCGAIGGVDDKITLHTIHNVQKLSY